MTTAALSAASLLAEVRAGQDHPPAHPPADPPFLANLDRLLASCASTARLNAVGADVLRKVAVRHLRNLLAVEAYAASHPDIARRTIASPVVVTGLPRTGTTLLHNLLALDPAHRALRVWEALQPTPPSDGRPGLSPEELQAKAQRWLDGFYGLVPDFRRIHPATATGPEECDALLQNTFASQHFDDMFDAHEYSSWLAGASLIDEYRHYALQLRLLGGERWVLKSPSHLGHLDALLAALPGCTVVVCHRSPREAVASHASLISTLRRAYSDTASAVAAGRQALDRAATAMDRAMAARDRHSAAFVDVAYRQLVDDPVSAVRQVYAATGRQLDDQAEQRVRQWVAANPADRHGRHRYRLEEFGLTADAVDARFVRYREAFGSLAG